LFSTPMGCLSIRRHHTIGERLRFVRGGAKIVS
jgi:hypothetical protein